MSQSPERCRSSPRLRPRRPLAPTSSGMGSEADTTTPPPPSPSYRRILVGALCFCVPTLLVSSSWQTQSTSSTTASFYHQWKFQVVQDTIFQTVGKSAENEDSGGDVGGRGQNANAMADDQMFHFCTESHVTAAAAASSNNEEQPDAADDKPSSLTLLYQCAGTAYDDFAAKLQDYAWHHSQNVNNDAAKEIQGLRTRSLQLQSTEKCTAIRAEDLPTPAEWGKRSSPLPDNVTILALGNSHLRQISKTLACQYSATTTSSSSLRSIRFLPSLESLLLWQQDDKSTNIDSTTAYQNSDGFVLEFDNGSRWISITNTVLVYSYDWKRLLQEVFLLPAALDAIVLGKFTTYHEAQHTNFARTMDAEQDLLEQLQWQWEQTELNEDDEFLTMDRRMTDDTGVDDDDDDEVDVLDIKVDFASIPPPDLVDVAMEFPNVPIISVNMFSKSDELRAQHSYHLYQEECEMTGDGWMNENVYLVGGRRYIDALGMECGTDDKNFVGTCHESAFAWSSRSSSSGEDEDDDHHRHGPEHPPSSLGENANVRRHHSTTTSTTTSRDPSDMHRCAGQNGGHADLIAWDIIEGLHWMINGAAAATVEPN